MRKGARHYEAIWYEKQGRAEEVLQFGDLPAPQPAPGEVRVRLHASGVNAADANRRAGRMHGGMEFPHIIPNRDGAGVIDRLGDGVDHGLLGSRVWLRPKRESAGDIVHDAGALQLGRCWKVLVEW